MIYEMLTRIYDVVVKIWILTTSIVSGQKKVISTQAEHGEMLIEILKWVKPGQAIRVVFTIFSDEQILTGVSQMDIKEGQEFDIAVAFLDAKNKPALVDGIPAWTNTNETSFTLIPSADGMSAHVVSLDVIGTARIEVKADADLGEGIKEITGFLDLSLVPGEAVLVQLNPGPVTDVPAPPVPEA